MRQIKQILAVLGIMFIFIILTSSLSLMNNKVTIDTNGNVDISGDMTYNFIHAVGSADSIAFVTGSNQNQWYKINTTAFVSHEAVGITVAGDSFLLITPGDYKIDIVLGASTTNANDRIRVKVFMNNLQSPTSLGRFIINSSGSSTTIQEVPYFWYLHGVTANTWISFRMLNQTGARAMTVRDFKVYISKIPE